MFAATLIEGAARFGRPSELGTMGVGSFGPEAAGGPGGAAVTWRQARATEVRRLVSLTPQNVFAPPVLLPPYQHRRDGDADLGDHVALGLPAGGSNVALWREVRSNGFIPTFAAVKSSSRPSGGVFSPAKRLSASGWLAGTPQAGALTDRTVAAWGESRPRSSARTDRGAPRRSRLDRAAPAARPRDRHQQAQGRDLAQVRRHHLDPGRRRQGAGRLYLTTYRP